jgi:hypothetical protein
MIRILAFVLGAAVSVGFALSVSGCISAVPVVPETPANAAQISGCQNIATTHNDLVIGDFVLSGGATGVGAVAAFETGTDVRTALAITSAILGAATAVTTAVTAFTASEFTNGQCSAVVGPLAAGSAGDKR